MTQRPTGSRILAQADIEASIVSDLELLEKTTYDYGDLLTAEALAAVKFKKKKARAFQASSGSVRDKEANSELESETEMREYLLAEAQSKAKREVMRMLHARLENMRSLNANVRSQV